MNAFTRMSAKGQVVVPVAVRDRLGWHPGADLELIEHGDSITLRPRRDMAGKISPDEAVARFQQLYRHNGPPVPIERLSWSSDMDDLDG